MDESPGVRPIGVGETLRRVIGKAIGFATRMDLEDVAGVSQLRADTKERIEGAVHALNETFEVNKNEGLNVLLVDAANAFISFNRIGTLWNVHVLWPRCSRFLFNTYQGWATFIIRGSSSVLYSKKGVPLGDPLSMLMYAVGSLPLIHSLHHSDCTQVWYADDASVCGLIKALVFISGEKEVLFLVISRCYQRPF